MITAKIIRFEANYPTMSAFVSFSDDSGTLVQPQTQQITFNKDDMTNLSKDMLYLKIKEYISLYEKMISNITVLEPEINKELNSGGIIK